MSDNILDIYEKDHNFKVGQLSPDNWTTTAEYRSRSRMKVTFKLNREETGAFTNFRNQTKPDQISEENFIKSIFFLGLTTLETNLAAKISEEMAKVDEDVQIPGDTGESMGDMLGIDSPNTPEEE